MLCSALTSCIDLLNVMLTELGFPSDQAWMSPLRPHICVHLHKNTGNPEKRWNLYGPDSQLILCLPQREGEEVQQQARLLHVENWRFASLVFYDRLKTVMRRTADRQNKIISRLKHMINESNLPFTTTPNKSNSRELSVRMSVNLNFYWVFQPPSPSQMWRKHLTLTDPLLNKCTVV